MKLFSLALIGMFAIALNVPTLNAAPTSCEKFLAAYIATTERLPSAVPLQNETRRPLSEMTLRSTKEVAAFHSRFPNSPWRLSLDRLQERDFANGQVIYVSEAGPTLWKESELNRWEAVTKTAFGIDPQISDDTLMEMARGGHVEGISPASHDRLRNSFLASMQGHLAQAESYAFPANLPPPRHPHEEGSQDFLKQFLQPTVPPPLMDPLTGDPVNLSEIKPEDQDMYLFAIQNIQRSQRVNQTMSELRQQAPSLRIDFRFDPDAPLTKFESAMDLYKVNDPAGARWIARIALREDLLRRLLVFNREGRAARLDSQLSEDHIFLLAAHPEMAPYWSMLADQKSPIRSYNLSNRRTYAFDLPELTVSAEGDVCRFEVNRSEWDPESSQEPIGFAFHLTTKNEERFDCNFVEAKEPARFREWLTREWASFETIIGRSGDPAPTLAVDKYQSRMELRAGDIPPVRIVAFYAYLHAKFAE